MKGWNCYYYWRACYRWINMLKNTNWKQYSILILKIIKKQLINKQLLSKKKQPIMQISIIFNIDVNVKKYLSCANIPKWIQYNDDENCNITRPHPSEIVSDWEEGNGFLQTTSK